jgi:hypothetical protein
MIFYFIVVTISGEEYDVEPLVTHFLTSSMMGPNVLSVLFSFQRAFVAVVSVAIFSIMMTTVSAQSTPFADQNNEVGLRFFPGSYPGVYVGPYANPYPGGYFSGFPGQPYPGMAGPPLGYPVRGYPVAPGYPVGGYPVGQRPVYPGMPVFYNNGNSGKR